MKNSYATHTDLIAAAAHTAVAEPRFCGIAVMTGASTTVPSLAMRQLR
jgi:hypothetical protein